jgi:ribose 5-phosphate isomerase B
LNLEPDPRCAIVQSFTVRIAIGADHAGFLLKEHFKQTLAGSGHTVDDHGTDSEASVDYPPICIAGRPRRSPKDAADRGIVLGGSGQGEQIAANKVAGVRAALCNDLYTARLSREHNNANVLSMGGRIVAFGLADEILTLWLATAFAAAGTSSASIRSQRRKTQPEGLRHRPELTRRLSRARYMATNTTTRHVAQLAETDPEIAGVLRDERHRQNAASS